MNETVSSKIMSNIQAQHPIAVVTRRTGLRADVIRVNSSLGSTQPEKSWMELLKREEFETLITASTDEPEVAQRWMRCITHGHEEEFPQLRVA